MCGTRGHTKYVHAFCNKNLNGAGSFEGGTIVTKKTCFQNFKSKLNENLLPKKMIIKIIQTAERNVLRLIVVSGEIKEKTNHVSEPSLLLS